MDKITPPPNPLPVNEEGESDHTNSIGSQPDSPIYEFVPSAFEKDGVFYPAITHLINGEFQYKMIVWQPFDNAGDVIPYANKYAQEEADHVKSVFDYELERQKTWLESPERERLLNESRERLKLLMKSEPAWGQSDILWGCPALRFGIGWGHDDDLSLMACFPFPYL